jgi:predicted TIM-barrel fold metal-dependent hydrolase
MMGQTTVPAPATAPGATRRAGHPIIDVDVHEALPSLQALVPYLDEPWREMVARGHWKGFTQPFVYWATGGGNRADAKPDSGGPEGSDYELMRRQLLDAYDLRAAILTGYFYPVMLGDMQVEFASALASAYNSYQIEAWLSADPRFRGSVHVAPQDPHAAAREIDRVGSHPQMVQALLGITTRAYGNPFYFPIFEAAQRNGLKIATHHTVYVEGALGMGRYYVERHMLIPQGTMAQLISLVCSGVFDRFPELGVVCLEGGFSWLPHLMWRMDREYKSLRQEVPWVKRLPSEHMRERLRLATQPVEDMSRDELLKVVDLIGSEDILMFATDYPHFDFDSPLRSLPPRLPDGLARKIFWENARSFYGLPEDDPPAGTGAPRDEAVAR